MAAGRAARRRSAAIVVLAPAVTPLLPLAAAVQRRTAAIPGTGGGPPFDHTIPNDRVRRRTASQPSRPESGATATGSRNSRPPNLVVPPNDRATRSAGDATPPRAPIAAPGSRRPGRCRFPYPSTIRNVFDQTASSAVGAAATVPATPR